MNTTPTTKVTADGPEVGVVTARLLLLHALEKEEQTGDAEHPDLVRERAVNDLTGASIHVPPKVMAEEQSGITTQQLKRDETTRKVMTKEIAPWLKAVSQPRQD